MTQSSHGDTTRTNTNTTANEATSLLAAAAAAAGQSTGEVESAAAMSSSSFKKQKEKRLTFAEPFREESKGKPSNSTFGGSTMKMKIANNASMTLTASVRKRRTAQHLGSLDFERVVNTYSIQAKQDLYGIVVEEEEVEQESEDDKDSDSDRNEKADHPPHHFPQYHQLPRQSKYINSRATTRWALTIVCALLSGLTTVVIVASTEKLVAWRTNSMNALLTSSSDSSFISEFKVFAWYALISVLLADTAALLCVVWAPEAVGSGIPEVIGYLNGIRVKKFNRKRMLIVKMVGSVLSVASSLAVGMEGPLVCIGAIVGAALANVGALLSWILTTFFSGHQSPILTRLWIWATSELSYFANDAERRNFITIGAACGFAASFGAPIGGLLFILDDISSFFEQNMFMRVLVANALGTFCLALYRGDLSSYGAIQFGTYDAANDNIFLDRFEEIPFWIVLGAVMGIMSGFFCMWFDRVKRWSDRKFNTPMLHMLRVTYMTIVTSAIMFYLPTMKWLCHDIDEYDKDNTDRGKRFFCDEGQINEMATIMFGSRSKAIVRILSDPGQFYPITLVLVGLIFFVLMLYTNTTFIPSGLFTPIVLSGASLGGAFGILLEQYVDDGINPSTFALLGVAAMMAGIQRSTVSTCVILVEGTGQIRVLLPVMVVVVVSNYFAYLVYKDGVYNVLLKIKGYPYLQPSEGRQSLDVFEVREIMSSPVVTVREKERASRLVKLLTSCRHNGFPVVDQQGRCKGLVRRKQIVALIECGIFQKRSSDDDDFSLAGSSRESDAFGPKSGGGAFQSLMHWALHVKDDRYGDDIPDVQATAKPVSEALDDDEFGENSFLLHIQRTLNHVGGQTGNGGDASKKANNRRTSFLDPSAMNKMNSSKRRITLGGDDAMPVIDTDNLQSHLGTLAEQDESDTKDDTTRRDSLISQSSTASTANSMLTSPVQAAPTGFARIGQDPVEGNVFISWLHPAHHDDVVNLEAVMNRGTYCVPEHFPISKAYRLFTKLGLRWIVVVGGGENSGGGQVVVGILTRSSFLNAHIYHRTGVDLSCFDS